MYLSGIGGYTPSPRAMAIASAQPAAYLPPLSSFHACAILHGAHAVDPGSLPPVRTTQGGQHVPALLGQPRTGANSSSRMGTAHAAMQRMEIIFDRSRQSSATSSNSGGGGVVAP
eukprot:scaffold15718_cov107-Isochrysis_galbana.AAC.1